MRTQQQITDDIEAAYQRLVEQKQHMDADPAIQHPCGTCRWYSMRGDDGWKWDRHFPHRHTCVCPLVKGFSEWGVELGVRHQNHPMPCGPEKALWTPRLSRLERIARWLTDLTSR